MRRHAHTHTQTDAPGAVRDVAVLLVAPAVCRPSSPDGNSREQGLSPTEGTTWPDFVWVAYTSRRSVSLRLVYLRFGLPGCGGRHSPTNPSLCVTWKPGKFAPRVSRGHSSGMPSISTTTARTAAADGMRANGREGRGLPLGVRASGVAGGPGEGGAPWCRGRCSWALSRLGCWPAS